MNNKLFRLGTSIIGAALVGLAPISAIAQSPNLKIAQERSLTQEILSKKTKLILAQNETDYDRAIQLNPDDAEAYLNRGILRKEQKNYPGAEADINQAIMINPKYAEAYLNRGILRYKVKNYPGAEADINRAITINPEYAEAYNNRGILRYQGHSYRSVEADFTQAIRINPKYAEAYYNRGILRYQVNNYPGAIADLQTAAQLYRQQGNPEMAQQTQQILTQLQAIGIE